MQLGIFRQTYILACFLLGSQLAYSQTGNSLRYQFDGDADDGSVVTGDQFITIDYVLPEINLRSFDSDNGAFFRIDAPGHSHSSDPGKPELPVFSRLIMVPEGAVCKTEISEVRSKRLKPSRDNIKGILFPAQHGVTKQERAGKQEFTIDRELYKGRKFIQTDTVRITPLGKIRGRQLSTLTISPVRYNPGSNQLEVITSMKVTVSFTGADLSTSKSALAGSALFDGTLEKGVLNYSPEDLITGYSDQPAGMIILTDTAYTRHLDPFFRWKKQKGLKLDILYVGEEAAGTTYQEIKESIYNTYRKGLTDGNPPEYLLIIGDVSRIPFYGTDNITDMYYAEFDGEGDYLPELFVGRIPAPDTTAVKSVINKLIEYEKFDFPDANTFHSRALIFAGKDASYANYMNGQIRYAITNYLTPANRINEYHFYYPEGYSRKDSILKIISNGVSFINYTGHGTEEGWLHVDIKTPDIKKFGNKSMYPFVISNACRTAEFDDTTSFGNKMLLTSGAGAVGFIGCSNDSYWDEDFTWAVGTGIPNSDPRYSQTGLGAYDRLFHNNNELPSDWYITMGQVNFAGNLSVSSSPSLKKKYYWETYTLLGDPSIIPFIGTPLPFGISIPDTLPRTIRSLSFIIEPFAYMAISHSDDLWDASHASASGSVTLNIPAVTTDSCLIVVTGQNRIPFIKTVYFSEISEEFINLSGYEINDRNGNNNGMADYGETLYLKLKIGNLGNTVAENISVTVSSPSPWVTINNSSVLIGDLPGRMETVSESDIQITINQDVPDLGIIPFDLTIKDEKTEKKYKIEITLHAPRLEIVNCLIDDSLYGNNNSIADPGESFDLVFQVRNVGSSNTSGQLIISSSGSSLEIFDSDIKSGLLEVGRMVSIPVSVKLSDNAIHGDFIMLSSLLDCSPYLVDKNFQFRVGRSRESFESFSFKVFPWINLSTKPWTISSGSVPDGILSARSGAISHNSSSVLLIRTFFPEPDTLNFHYKVSSELSYDFFQFSINGRKLLEKSGETSWNQFKIPVESGYNKLEWIYKKDNSVSAGQDCAWIDLIDFSESAKVNFIQKDLEVAKVVSPFQKEVYGQEPVTVKVMNLGRDTINGFTLAYSVNDRFPVIQKFKDKLAPYQDTLTVTFDRKADLDLNGIYEVAVFGYENEDDYLSNDTLKIKVENREIEESVSMYPNPFNDHINITINSRQYRKVRITLTNLAGRQVYSLDHELTEGENQILIATQNLPPSVYILNISNPSFPKAYQMIKLKR